MANTSLSCKTRKEIATELNISQKTLERRIKELGLNLPRVTLLSPSDYRPIYDAIQGNNHTMIKD